MTSGRIGIDQVTISSLLSGPWVTTTFLGVYLAGAGAAWAATALGESRSGSAARWASPHAVKAASRTPRAPPTMRSRRLVLTGGSTWAGANRAGANPEGTAGPDTA